MYDDAVAAGADEINTRSRLRLQIDATTETDGGLTLGVRSRAQTEENARNAGFNEARFFGSAGGLTIAMGNILGVIESAPNLYLPTKSAGVGLEGNYFAHLATNFDTQRSAGLRGASRAQFGWTAYQSGGAAQSDDGVEIIYSMNGIGLHAHSTDDSWALGANYKFADYTAAVAYEEFDGGDNILFASVGGKFGAFDAALSYAKGDLTTAAAPATTTAPILAAQPATSWEAEKFVLRAGYTANDALYVYGFVATEDNNVGVSVDEAYGLGASYALGGGASVEGGWESRGGDNRVSAGIFFSF
jgi:outer membrane protein OmpU